MTMSFYISYLISQAKLFLDIQKNLETIICELKKNQTISSKLWVISDLLSINPRYFLGDCERILRILSKHVKTLMYEKEFSVANNLLIWMIHLLNNVEESRVLSWFYSIWNLVYWFAKHVSACTSTQELITELKAFALQNLNNPNIDITIEAFSYLIDGK